jgi:uncharacterized Fe-S cluster protein YjdI
MQARRLQTYETEEIIVTFDPSICIHSGVCVRGLPAVFDVKRKRWVRPDLGSAEEVAAQVRRCPSGALQYEMKGEQGGQGVQGVHSEQGVPPGSTTP